MGTNTLKNMLDVSALLELYVVEDTDGYDVEYSDINIARSNIGSLVEYVVDRDSLIIELKVVGL